ncbi:MAG: DUF1186 domain-containing protein [Acidobacteriota bacterium]
MEIQAIIDALAHTDSEFPRQALQAAIAQQPEITPHLLEMLERAITNPEAAIASGSWDYGYAIFLLAQFRETRACPLIVKLASFPSDTLNRMLGDSITEDLHNILASVSGGDTRLIKSLIENPNADEFARSAAIESLLALVVEKLISRDEVIDYFRTLFNGGLEKKESFVWDGLIASATDLYPEELYEDIKKALLKGFANERIQDLDYVDQKIREGKEAVLAQLPERFHFIENFIEDMESWAWYQDEDIYQPVTEDSMASAWGATLLNLKEAVPDLFNRRREGSKADMPYIAPKKVGRNEPCPCGSGKKYKKCCGAA